MALEQLEAEVLALPRDVQATLVARLLHRLEQDAGIDQATTATWVRETEKRDAEMNAKEEAC